MNIDHFFFVDIEDLSHEPTPHINQKVPLQTWLLKDFQDLREKNRVHHNDYIIVNVGPSVVPEYFPSFRVYQYNITGYDQQPVPRASQLSWTSDSWQEQENEEKIMVEQEGGSVAENDSGLAGGSKRKHGHRHPERPDCSKKENKVLWACRPWGPRHSSNESPSRTNRLWSLLGYAQVII